MEEWNDGILGVRAKTYSSDRKIDLDPAMMTGLKMGLQALRPITPLFFW